jgi:lipopolysaccharide/colanic/teichoic acid biosynthesis glycosyltransferase
MHTNAQFKGTLTVGMRDPRITRIGVFIRKFKLDEFPQFINVLSGSMSIVGPRPEVEEFVKLYNEDQKKVLTVKPGITDYASIAYFKENEILAKSEDPKQAYIDEIMPDKLRINLEYIRKQSVWEDFKIIIKTFGKIIKN